MLNVINQRQTGNCAGMNRRDALRVGSLGMGGFTLSHLLRARALGATTNEPANQVPGNVSSFRRDRDTSVIWLWLGGGATHVETFDPKMTAPMEYRSITGEASTPMPGVTIGGTFPNLAKVADKMALVRSFAHQNSGHGGGTHWVMTGYDHRAADAGEPQVRPSIGSIVSRVRGTNHPITGMPTYVRINDIYGDGSSFLGTAYAPFQPGGDALRNMQLNLQQARLEDRRSLLKGLDNVRRDMDAKGLMEGLDDFERQAFQLVLGKAPEAFDLRNEDPRVVERYGSGIGEQLLQARRLCEAGCGFATIHYGGWDMHGNIKDGMQNLSPALDRALAAFLEDTHQRGVNERILLVISGEFGRTPRINGSAGRDHWAPLSTLAFAGGGLKMGQVVGESAPKLDVPKSRPITPQDMMATIFHSLGIDPHIQFVNTAGRPTYMIEDGHPIEELI